MMTVYHKEQDKNMVYCHIPRQIRKVIEEDLESGTYIMNDHKAKKYFETLSRLLGTPLKSGIKSEDIAVEKYDVTLSEIIREYRNKKYDSDIS